MKLVAKARSYAVTFRLAKEEYDDLLKTVVSEGARSVSDYTRAAVLGKVSGNLTNKLVEDELYILNRRLEAFDLTLKDLRRHVQELIRSTTERELPKTS